MVTMMRFSPLVFAFTFVLAGTQIVSAQVQGQWVITGTMQTDREFNAQVKLANGKILSIGGIDNNNSLLASAEIYDSASRAWAPTNNMAQPREVFPAVVLTNGKVLVSGGLGAGSTVLAAAELYDPMKGTWSPVGSLAVARYGHTATLLQTGKVLVTGGCTASACSTDTAVSELYDPVSNTWSTTGSLNTARYSHTAVLLNTGMHTGKVLAVGGSAGSSCELYDPSKGTWSKAASTNVSRGSNATTMLPDGKVLITGGASGRFPINSAEIYDPSVNTWTPTGNMTTGRYAHTATLLTDGTVVIAGGIGQSISCGKACTGFIPTAKVDIYNEAAGRFTAAASLTRALAYHSTTLLGSGEALTNGGRGTTAYCCVVVNTAEIYTPLTMTFSSSSLNFGLLKIGLTSTSPPVTVTNVSSHQATISSITPSGDYSETNTCLMTTTPITLNSGQNCMITITFKPTAEGTRQGAVTLKDNDPGSPLQVIALTGFGETLALGFSPSSLNLGTVPVGLTSSQSATLTNDSAAPVNITGISISPSDGTFTQTHNCPATLNVQQTCTFTIVFTPPDVFPYNATLSVANNGNGTAQLPIKGTGADGP
jgi:hypothetical protein